MTDQKEEKRVRMKHCKQMGFCIEGMRTFGKKHGLSFSKLVYKGLPVSELRKINDIRAQKIVNLVEREEEAK